VLEVGELQGVLGVEPLDPREEVELEVVADAEHSARMQVIDEVVLAAGEALTEVEPDPCVAILEQDLVAADLVHAAVEGEGRHDYNL